jgi:diguanylate cyclase (GGDEF)-like protein
LKFLLSLILAANLTWTMSPGWGSESGGGAPRQVPQSNDGRNQPAGSRSIEWLDASRWWVAAAAVIVPLLLYQQFERARLRRRMRAARDAADEAVQMRLRFQDQICSEIRAPIGAVLRTVARVIRECDTDGVRDQVREIEASLLPVVDSVDRILGSPGEAKLAELSERRAAAVVEKHGSAGDTGAQDLPAPSDALNRDAGLRWTDGDAALYERMLEEFYLSYRGELGRLGAATTLERSEEIEKLAHALKSNAAMIGAESLARAAAELDADIQCNGRPDVQLIAKVRALLTDVIRALSGRFPPHETNGKGSVCDPLPGDDGRAAILVVDDEPANLLSIREFLSPEHRVYCVGSGEQAIEDSDREPRPDLILLDVVMPGMDGFEVCRRLKSRPSTRNIPVVFVTGRTDVVDERKGLELGAVDYIRKPFRRAVLEARVRSHVALKRQGDFLEQLSGTDALTDIANRRRLDEVLKREWHNAIRNRRPLALLMMDIDEFKAFNDRYGHDAGDDCLKRIGMTLDLLCRRKTDLVARYGGEEFCCVMPDTDMSGAEKKASELVQAIRDLRIPHDTSSVFGHVTASVGIAVEVPRPGDSLRAFCRKADERLYQAKREGRNRVAGG